MRASLPGGDPRACGAGGRASLLDDARGEERALVAEELARARRESRERLGALVTLLEDDAPHVRRQVGLHLERARGAALPSLRRAAKVGAPRLRSRARALLLALAKRDALRRLVRYLCRPQIDLERAFFLLGRHHTPGLDPRPYLRALDAMALEVSRRAHLKHTELERAATLCEYLGGELGLGGSRGPLHHPDNIHLHRAIERRAGMPLTLCALYAFVARRANLRVALVPLPGHVMLRLYGEGESRIVDPYHRGRERSQRDLLAYLAQHGLSFEPRWFKDADERSIVRRQLQNLARSAQKRGLRRDLRELRHSLAALERAS